MASVVSSSTAPSSEASPDLSLEEIRQALRLQNTLLVAEVDKQVRAVAAEEAARHARLDTKANTLLGVIGLLVALVTVLLPKATGVSAFLVVVAATCALVSVGFAVRALLVTSYARVPDAALFSRKVLDDADDLEVPADGVALYQRYLVQALWEAHQASCAVNDRKSRAVRLGQVFFAAAILVGTVAAGAIALSPSPHE